MLFGLCITFALIAFVSLITAIAIDVEADVLFYDNATIDSTSCSLRKKKALVFAFIMCISIGVSVTTGKINSDRDRVAKMHIDNTEFQNKLISSYKEKYGLDENIVDYSGYIKESNSAEVSTESK